MKIHFSFADNSWEFNTSIHRCLIPAMAIKEAGYDVSYGHTSKLDSVHADVVIIERQFFLPEVHYNIQRLRKEGSRIIGTWDDAYHLMPDCVKSKPAWNAVNLARFRHGLKFLDVGIVPNELLARDFSRNCKDIRVVPNYCDGQLYTTPHKPDNRFIRIFYGGNDTHEQGIVESGVIPALQKLLEKYPKAGVYVVGTPRIVCLFRDNLPSGRVGNHGWMSYDEWPKYVAERADIIIVPLSGEYDRRRSSIKANDAAVLAIPMVASDLEPYRGTGACLVNNTEGQWYNALSNLVYSDFARRTLGKRIAKTMGDVTMKGNVGKYEELFL